jgi:hypothetical protein
MQSIQDKNMLPNTFLYEWEWADRYWDIMHKSRHSSNIANEQVMINENQGLLKPYYEDAKYFIDLWAWDGSKVIRMIENVSNTGFGPDPKQRIYIANDSSFKSLIYLWHTQSNINQQKYITFDLRRHLLQDIKKYSNHSPKILTLFGNTLGNYEEIDRQTIMTDSVSSLQAWESLFLSVYLVDEKDPENAIDLYNGEEGEWFASDALKSLWWDTGRDKMRYYVTYDHKNNQVIMKMYFLDTQTVSQWNVSITKKNSDYITCWISKRFTMLELETLVKNANGIIKQTLTKDSTCLVVIQKAS